MSKQCPYCGSWNTEVVVGNYVGRGLVNTGRFALAAGAAMVVGLFNHTAGHAAGHAVMHNTDPGEFHGHRCCECGREFE